MKYKFLNILCLATTAPSLPLEAKSILIFSKEYDKVDDGKTYPLTCRSDKSLRYFVKNAPAIRPFAKEYDIYYGGNDEVPAEFIDQFGEEKKYIWCYIYADQNAFDKMNPEGNLSRNGYTKIEVKKSLTSDERVLPLLYLDTGPGAPRGYRSASINLRYRFLVCAGEVQIAYGLDRKSLSHSKDYAIYLKNGQAQIIEPKTEPLAPTTVPIELSITVGPAATSIATIKDGIAGESLGSGCFTGQTKTIGTLAKLIGPKATPAQAKAYIDKLRARHLWTNSHLPYTLLNPDVPIPANAAPMPRSNR